VLAVERTPFNLERCLRLRHVIYGERYPIWRRCGDDDTKAEKYGKKDHQALASAPLGIAAVTKAHCFSTLFVRFFHSWGKAALVNLLSVFGVLV